jgi:hypothetical protein
MRERFDDDIKVRLSNRSRELLTDQLRRRT